MGNLSILLCSLLCRLLNININIFNCLVNYNVVLLSDVVSLMAGSTNSVPCLLGKGTKPQCRRLTTQQQHTLQPVITPSRLQWITLHQAVSVFLLFSIGFRPPVFCFSWHGVKPEMEIDMGLTGVALILSCLYTLNVWNIWIILCECLR
jgi:hypothetical protein